MTTKAYIALGSNLGDRSATIASAIRALADLENVRLLATSSIIETAPIGPGQDYRDPGGPYLNAVVEIETTLAPRQLLERCLEIERRHGRVRKPDQRWGARTLDLDMLICGGVVLDEHGLTLPHPRLHQRDFVLGPLAEIAPDLIHPTLGQTVQCLLRNLQDGGRPQ